TIDGIVCPRRAGITALGSGGVNAHVIVEEYPQELSEEPPKLAQGSPQIIILSAKNDDRRQAQIVQLMEFLDRDQDISLADLAFTLQVGREAMASRVALVVNSIDELRTGLNHLLGHIQVNLSSNPPTYLGNINETDNSLQTLLAGGADAIVLQLFLEQRNYQKLAQFWVQGGKIPWISLWEQQQVQRISLPTYPFEQQCYWQAVSSSNSARSPLNEAIAADTKTNPPAANPSVQEIVAAIVATSIGLTVSEIKPHVSLWQLGVDSLRSKEIVRQIEKRLYVEIGHRELA
ncbi:MAG: ketoacyl-synthetase C-terminal extension domain-containing protein, partial [bacterium]